MQRIGNGILNQKLTPSNVASTTLWKLALKPGDIVETFWKNSRSLGVVTEHSSIENPFYKVFSSFGFVMEKKKYFVRNCFSDLIEPKQVVEIVKSNEIGFLKTLHFQLKDNEFSIKKEMERVLSSLEGFPFPFHPFQICSQLFESQVSLANYYGILTFMNENGFYFVKDNMKMVNGMFYLRKKKSRHLIGQLNSVPAMEIAKFKEQVENGIIPEPESGINGLLMQGLKNYAFSSNENLFCNPFETIALKLCHKIENVRECSDVLRSLDLIKEDFNPNVFQSNLMLETTKQVEVESEVLLKGLKTGDGQLAEEREDFNLPCFTIDSLRASEIDDGISIEEKADGSVIYHVHVADPTSIIKQNSKIDLSAKFKATSVYLPEVVYPMIPFNLAGAMGIVKQDGGASSNALTFSFKMNDQGEIVDYWMKMTRLWNVKRLTYEQVEEVLSGALTGEDKVEDALLLKLDNAACLLNQKRIRNGLIQLDLPRLHIYFENNQIQVSNESTPFATRLVSEFMIAAGSVAGLIACDAKIALPFRRQDKSALLTEADEDLMRSGNLSLIETIKFIKKMETAYYSCTPGLHYSMNSLVYAKATSPLRRYGDIITHRQLKGLKDKKYLQSEDEISKYLALLNDLEKRAKRLQRNSQRFWTLKLIEFKKEEELKGVVVNIEIDSIEVFVKEFCISCHVKSLLPLQIGDEVDCRINYINPYRNIIELDVKVAIN